jgi:hypothetical protein
MRTKITLAMAEYLQYVIRNIGRPTGLETVTAVSRLFAQITEAINEEEEGNAPF